MAKKKGTAGNDVVNGTNGDSWDLLDGNDRFNGGSFADTVYGGTGNDSLYGGGGNDKLYGGDGNDLLDGGTGDDSLYGDGGSDTILAGDGNDYVSGSAGADSLSGGAGNDTIVGGGGADTIDGGEGNNRLAGGSSNERISAGAGNDTIYGGGGSDTIDAGNGDNEIHARGDDDDGDDDHHGNGSSSGGDVITAGSGNDTIYAGSGNDSIYGGEGANRIYGGRGNDLIVTGSGNDRIYGSAGNDTIDAGGGNNELYLGSGNERVTVGDGNNLIYGGGGADSVYAGNGNNEIYLGGDGWGNSGDFVQTGSGNDTIYGGAGSDTVNAGGGNNFLRLGSGSDLVTAGSGNDTIYGGSGNDTIDAGGGNNYVRGGSGNDSINAGSGDDYIEGYEGSDRINAGDGNNFIRLGSGNDTVTAGSGNDTVYGGSSSDVISVGAGNDYVESGDGNDSIEAGRGNDTVDAGSGNDTVGNTFGAADRDRLDGGRGTDQLRLDFTRAEWMNGAVQTDIANYLRFLSTNSNANSSNGRTFEFTSTDLDVRNFEGLSVTVDGVALTAADDAVDAVNDTASVGEDNVLTGSVLGNDVAPDLIASVQLVTPPSQGGLTFNADGTYSFTPGAAFQHLAQGATATTSFTYRVTDADGDSDVATVTITVIGTNDGPVAVADSAVVNERSAVTVDVLANDTDIDDNHAFTLTGVSVAQGQGTAAIVNNRLVFAAGNDFDFLGQGETRAVTVTYTMRDEFGAVSSATATITVQGTNDGPVAAALAGSIGEDDLSIVLTPSYSDADTSDTHTISLLADGGALSVSSSSIAGEQDAVLDLDQGGRVTLNPDGTFTFSTAGDFEHLAAGEQVDVSFQYRVTDNHGASSVATATVRVTGANDAPDARNISATVSEDGPAIVLTPSYVDVDLNDTHTVSLLQSTSGASGSSGSLSLVTDLDIDEGILHANADGTISFDPAGRLDALAEGETAQVSFRYGVSDSHGGFDGAFATITVTGVNDGPVADAISASVGEDDPSITLTASYSDIDTSDTHTISLLADGGALSVSSSSIAGVQDAVLDLDQGGRVTLNPDGTFTFSTAGDFEHLAAGEQVDVSFQYRVTDNHGASSVATATVRVTGANDAPVITSGAQTGSVEEEFVLTATGQVTASDVDHGAVLTYATDDAAGDYGSLALDAHTGQWTYTLANDSAAVQGLSGGQVVQDVFTVSVTDEHGAVTTQTVTINVTGTADAPVITSGPQSGTVQEDSVLATAGEVTAVDNDPGSFLFYGTQNTSGVFGTFSVGFVSGNWAYDLDNSRAAVQALAEGESATETFQVFAMDNTGLMATQDVIITVLGSNDAPVIASLPTGSQVLDFDASFPIDSDNYPHVEDGYGGFTWSTSNSQNDNLPSADFLANGDAGVLNGAAAGWNGYASKYTYIARLDGGDFNFEGAQWHEYFGASQITLHGFNNGVEIGAEVIDLSASYQFFASGLSGIDQLVVEVTQGSVPVMNGLLSGWWGVEDFQFSLPAVAAVVAEDGVLTTSGSLNATDVDHGAVLSWSVDQSAGAFGSLSINDQGQWTYTLDNGSAAVQALALGEAHAENFTVRVTDEHGASDTQVVTVMVQGANDAPVASAISGSTSENGPSIILTPSYTDIDTADTHSISLTDTSTNSASSHATAGTAAQVLDLDVSGGHLHVNPDGTIAFTPQGNDFLGEGESRTVEFQYRVTDSAGAFSNATASVTINGQNDAPEAEALAGSVNEGAGPLTLVPVWSDKDASDTQTITVSEGGGQAGSVLALSGGGIITVNSDGSLSFDQNGAFEDLSAGETRDVTFQFQVTDSHGAAAIRDLTITVTGSNDGPVASAITGATSEDGPAIVLQPSFTDVDANDTHTVTLLSNAASQSSHATAASQGAGVTDLVVSGGALHVNGDGSISFDPTGANEGLAQGETRDVVFTYQVTDNHGGHSTATGTITVTGENDAPVANALTASVAEDVDLVLTPSFTDVDVSDTHTITLRAEVTRPGGSAGSTHVETGNDIDLGNGAHITLNPDGTISFVQNGAYDSLNDGDRAPISFEYIVTDNNGAQSVADVTIFVNGVTDQSAALVAVDDAFIPPEFGTAVLAFDDSSLVGYNSGGNYYAGEVGTTYDGFVFGGVGYYQYNFVYVEAEVLVTYAGYYGYYQPSIRAVDGADFAVSSFDIAQAYDNYGAQGFPLEIYGYLDGVQVGYQLVYPEYAGNVFVGTPYTPPTHVELDAGFLQVDLITFRLFDYKSNYLAIDNLEVGTRGSTENFAMDLAVLGNDTDSAAGAVLSVQSVQGTSALGATVTINPDGTLHYDSTAAGGANALAAGEAADDTFTYTVTDQFGNSDTATVTVHLTGVDDRALAVDDTATLALAGGSTVSGNVLTNDTDPDSPLALLSSSGEYFISYGSLLLSADGSFTYTANPGDVAFLGEGQSATSQFSYQLVGGDTGLLTITINGVNDGPVATTDVLNDGPHDAFTTASAPRSVSIDRLLNNDFDPDSGDSFGLWSVSGTSASGATVVWNTETNEFTYDASSVAAFQSLAEGETATDSFTYVIRDSHGVEATGTAQVVVAGNPVAPVAVDDSFDRTTVDTSRVLTFDDFGANLNGPFPTTYAGLEFTGFYLTGYWGVNYSTAAYTWSQWNWGGNGADASFRTADGSNFDLNGFNATTYFYSSPTELLQVRGYDNGVQVAAADLVLTYAEYLPNHQQVFSLGSSFDSIDEVRFYMPAFEVVDGQYWYPNYLWLDNVAIGAIAAGEDIVSSLDVLANDADASALHVSGTSGTSALGATLSVNADGTVAYNPLNVAAIQALDAGETITDTFTYTVMDEYGLTDTATVTVVVGGADDAAVAVDDTASATEDGGVITGNLLANDYDPEGNAPVVLASQMAGEYGLGDGAVLTVNADGSYQFAVNGAYQNLNAGETLTETFSYQLESGDSANLSITVTGTNDAPVAKNDSFGSATQGPGSGGGALPSGYIYNPENGHYYRYVSNSLTLDQHVAAAAAEGAYVVTVTSLSESNFIADNVTTYALLGGTDRDQEGTWVWVGGPEAGQTFWLGYYNGYSPSGFAGWGPQNGEPNNAGDEDYVVMYGANYWNDQYNYFTPSVYEIGGMGPFTDENTVGAIDAARLLVNDTDVDTGHVLHVVSVSGTSASGAAVSFDSQTGQISYDARGAAAVQALHDGEFLTDTFTYTMADEHGATSTATVSVVVGGVTENEAPTAVADTAQGTEDSVSITGSVLANDTDPDAGDVLSVSDAGVRQGTYGVLTLNADGTFSYVPDPVAQALFGGQVVTDTFAYTASDAGGLTSQGSLAVQLTGVNDPAVISGTNQGEVFEDGILVASGDLNAADPDNAADSWQAASGTSANGIGSFTIGADGVWTYTLDNANPLVQAANTGESIADFFNVSTADGTQTTVFIAVRGQTDNLNLTGDAFDNTLTGGPGPDTLSGLDGNDVIIGNASGDQLFGGNGSDTIFGNDGDDTISGGLGVDSLDGGPGTDTLVLSATSQTGGMNVNLVTGLVTVPGTNALIATIANFENVVGSTAVDSITGDDNPNFLRGGAGGANDVLNGAGGNDTLQAETPSNTLLSGGAGDDLLIAGPGNDSFAGGLGIDTISFVNASQGVAFSLASSIFQSTGGSGSDRQLGSPSENLVGSAFNDTLTGSLSTASGLINTNVLDGAAGDDVLSGLAGNDTLIGNIGNDLMTGGLDADDFVFRPGDGFDAVTDFTAGSDNVVLEGFGPDIDTFAEISTHLVQSNADTVITLSASQTITLLNVTASLLTQDDFIFR